MSDCSDSEEHIDSGAYEADDVNNDYNDDKDDDIDKNDDIDKDDDIYKNDDIDKDDNIDKDDILTGMTRMTTLSPHLRLDARDLPIGHDADRVCHLPAPALGVPAVVDHKVVGADLRTGRRYQLASFLPYCPQSVIPQRSPSPSPSPSPSASQSPSPTPAWGNPKVG